MKSQRRAGDDRSTIDHTRTDRFFIDDEGYHYHTREGLMGPFKDLSSALIGLMDSAKKTGMPQYQANQLYKSICDKVLESC